MIHIPKENIHTNHVKDILTPDCHEFISNIHNKFSCELSKKDTNSLNFREDTQNIRDLDWTGETIPDYLSCRHVEITGPASNAKMMINAVNSEADGYMADLEDSMTPTFSNVMSGHYNIKNAIRDQLTHETTKKLYKIQRNVKYMFVRARGLHLKESNVIDQDGEPINATLFDIGVYMFHNAKFLTDSGRNPLLYIPKLDQRAKGR